MVTSGGAAGRNGASGELRPADAINAPEGAIDRESAGDTGGSSDLVRVAAVRAAGLVSREVAEQLAINAGVCIRPIPMRRQDVVTGVVDTVDMPCGSWRESWCPPCAKRARQVRQAQCREGWHMESEPLVEYTRGEYRSYLHDLREQAQGWRNDAAAAGEDTSDFDLALAELDAEIGALQPVSRITEDLVEQEDAGDDASDGVAERRSRSTRRRDDAVNLPRRQRVPGTLGRVYEGRDGKGFRPSMFLTLTLPSYGRVLNGVPVDPENYDYRSATRDALHFSKLVDRFVQNLRRVAGWEVQYFAAVEPQRRLTPHLHMAIRGTLPRSVLRQVVEATYHQVWWPSVDRVVFGEGDAEPVWSDGHGYVRPSTGEVLPSWDEALDALEDHASADDGPMEPLHVARFGSQMDMQGVLAGTADADQRVRYLTKYLTKSLSWDAVLKADDGGSARAAHVARLGEALRWEPCSPECANWLRYGLQPRQAKSGLRAGWCRKKAHSPDRMGYGGRRVLVSRKWSGKTLAGHKADRRAWALAAAGLDPEQEAREPGRYVWRRLSASDPALEPVAVRLLRLVAARQAARAAREGPPDGGPEHVGKASDPATGREV
uniref:replication initiator n=1 Tax=Herbidospora sakaeratensis TaxID=564415 RepID=UPI000AA67479|nr:replication initiator [Herbidospora sakaeratensis]